MRIYHFDKDTKEFTYSTMAECNPEETKLKGRFVPLIPANATIVEPPKIKENEVLIFDIKNNKWKIEPDYRKDFKLLTTDFNIRDIKKIGKIQDGFVVPNELAELIKQNPSNFKIGNGKVLKKSKAEIEQEKLETQNQQRIAEIKLELETIDKQKIRAITEPEIKDKTTNESWLEYYNNKAKGLREELKTLDSEVGNNEQ